MLAAGAAALPASAMFLASARGQAPATGTAPAAGDRQPMGRDPLLGACLLVGGKRQIEACRWAMDKLQNDDCKAFAKAEIDEHENIKAQLKTFGLEFPKAADGTSSIALASGMADGSTATPAGGTTGTTATPPPVPQVAVGRVALPGAASEFVAIDVQVGEQCVANYKKMMSKKQGLKFDKAFVGDQLHEHQGLLDKVQVFRQHASPEMQQVLAQGQQIIEQHIATCEQLMNKLDQATGGGAERKDG
jgi:predicted outer membrane protein